MDSTNIIIAPGLSGMSRDDRPSFEGGMWSCKFHFEHAIDPAEILRLCNIQEL